MINEEINNIFYDLEKNKFNYDKTIKIFSKSKIQKINLNDYIFFFIQTIKNINWADYFQDLNLEAYELQDLSLENCFSQYLQNKISLKNIIIETLSMNFTKNSIKISSDNLNYYEIYTENKFYHKWDKYCANIINKLYIEGNVLYCLFLNLYEDMKNGHASVLIILKNNDGLELFIYDPNGMYSFYKQYTSVFLETLKKYLKLNSKKHTKKIDIIIMPEKIFGIKPSTLQVLFEVEKKYGYCGIFSLFFLYCFLVVFIKTKNKNFTFLLQHIYLYFIQKFEKEGSNKVYFSIVNFANNIKDIFLRKINQYENKTNILVKINEYIIYLVEIFKGGKEYIDEKSDEYILINDNTDILDNENRNYDEELKLLDWKNIKEKRENEKCKIDDECISKLCVKNKCTKPNDNDKLDFLTRLEWKEVEENEEIEKIKIFCKEKTFENFQVLNLETKEFFIIGFNYVFDKLKDDNLKLTSEFKLYLQDTKNISDYKNKYENFKKKYKFSY